jgi:hypothetical protein
MATTPVLSAPSRAFAAAIAQTSPGGCVVGFFSSSTTGKAATDVMLLRCVAVSNPFDLVAAGTTLQSTQSTVTGNGVGWSVTNGGTLFISGDNDIDRNTDDGGISGTLATR